MTTTGIFDNTGNDLTPEGKHSLGPVLQELARKIRSGETTRADTNQATEAMDKYSINLTNQYNAANERYELLKIQRETNPKSFHRDWVRGDERDAKYMLDKFKRKSDQDLKAIAQIREAIALQEDTKRQLKSAQELISDIQQHRARIEANGGREALGSDVSDGSEIPIPASRKQAEDEANSGANSGANSAASQSSKDVIAMLKDLLDRAQSLPSTQGRKYGVVEVPQNVDQSKHVQQTNHINVTVNGAPATAGNAAAASLKAATSQALRDTD